MASFSVHLEGLDDLYCSIVGQERSDCLVTGRTFVVSGDNQLINLLLGLKNMKKSCTKIVCERNLARRTKNTHTSHRQIMRGRTLDAQP